MSLHCLLCTSDFHLPPRKENYVGNRKYGMVGRKWDKGNEGKGESLMDRWRMGKRDLRGRSWRRVGIGPLPR